jgi:exopolysaccharide production protein ExoZ
VAILSVQYLRGCAALMIVFVHLGLQLKRVGYEGYWPYFLSAGVDIFFVISGFIMWITTARGMTTLEFFRRRFLRVVPLYWSLTSVILATLIAFPDAVQSGQIDRWHVFGSYLFIPVLHPIVGMMQPLLIPGWTLNYEMFFYLIFGFALILPITSRLIVVSTTLIVLTLFPFLVKDPPLTAVPVTAVGFYTSNIILEFAFGMTLGWLYIRGARLSLATAWAILLLGAGAIVLTADSFADRSLRVGVPALLVVAGAVMIERLGGVPNIRGLYFLGNASYSLYLSHTIVLSIVGQLWRKFPLGLLPGSVLVFACISVASAIAVGALIYLYVEVPMLRLGRLQIVSAAFPKQRRAL